MPYTVAGTDLRVVDQEMRDVPADGATMGEAIMRGNNVMLGYYKNPQATEEAFRGGWFHSGDLAVMHPDGYIEVRDRQKDIDFGRREHFVDRGGEGAGRASGGAGSGGGGGAG